MKTAVGHGSTGKNRLGNAVVAVLLVALAVANAGLIAAPYSAIAPAPYTALSYAAAPVVAAPYAAPYAAAVAPVSYAAHAAYAAPIGAGYTAVTRGAVHSAPLPGHAIGSAHVNVAPAPGTI